MILAAGEGRRLMPLTLAQAKPTIPVLGRPLVIQILQRLVQGGAREVVLNLHHHPESIKNVLGGSVAPALPAVRYSHEETILGTAGGIRRAAPLLRDGNPIVVHNADSLSDIDMGAAFEAHRRSGCMATLVLAPARPQYSAVQTDSRGRVLSLAGEPAADSGEVVGESLFTGCQIIEDAVFDLIPAEGPSDIVRDVYRPLCESRQIGAYFHEGFWWEFGSPEMYLDGSLRLLGYPPERLRDISADHDALRQIGDGVAAVGPGAEIDDSVRLDGRAALGYASHLSNDVSIADSIVLPEAWIGPGCRLSRSIIGQGVELPAGFVADDSVICNDVDPALSLPPAISRDRGLLTYRLAIAARASGA
jgi:mannose-1-phosphate guanylyltransferase